MLGEPDLVVRSTPYTVTANGQGQVVESDHGPRGDF